MVKGYENMTHKRIYNGSRNVWKIFFTLIYKHTIFSYQIDKLKNQLIFRVDEHIGNRYMVGGKINNKKFWMAD